MELAPYFGKNVTEKAKAEILESFGAVSVVSVESMSPYFEYYRRETLSSTILSPPPIQSHQDIAVIFRLIKTSIAIPKATVLSLHSNWTPAALDLTVRAMLMTACRIPGSSGADIFNPSWKPNETLEQFINRAYPKGSTPGGNIRNQPVSISKLAANRLAHDTRVTIRYTDRLTDHLELRVGTDWKTVYLFKYPCYLRMCLEALQKDRPNLNHSANESLGLYVTWIIRPIQPD